MATQFLFKLCAPRTKSTPLTERDKQRKKNTLFSQLQPARLVRSLKLYMVIEDVETIKKVPIIFDPTHSFPTGCTEKFGVNDDTRFLSNNSVTCEANCIKRKAQCRIVGPIKAPNTCRNWSKGSSVRGVSLAKSGIFLPFWGRVPTPGHRLA